MQYYLLPLDELICAKDPKPRTPVSIDVSSMVSEACKFIVPANTGVKVSRVDVPSIKDYLQDVSPETMVPRAAELFVAAGMPPADMALRSQAVCTYLKSSLPQSEYELTPTGLRRVVEPSKSEDIKFLWKCNVSENPWYVMNLFATRMLTGSDMDCLKAVYPEEYDILSAALLDYILENHASDSSIPRNLRLMLAIFFGQPTIKLEQLAAYTKTNDEAAAKSGSTPSNLAAQEAPQAAKALRG